MTCSSSPRSPSIMDSEKLLASPYSSGGSVRICVYLYRSEYNLSEVLLIIMRSTNSFSHFRLCIRMIILTIMSCTWQNYNVCTVGKSILAYIRLLCFRDHPSVSLRLFKQRKVNNCLKEARCSAIGSVLSVDSSIVQRAEDYKRSNAWN
jgi:hypothetical protein